MQSMLEILVYVTQNPQHNPHLLSVYHPGTMNKVIQLLASCTLPKSNKLECGPMPNVMVALPNIGGALCSTPQFD